VRLEPWMVRLIVGTIVGMWVISTVAEIFLPHYEPPPSLNALFLLLVGAVPALNHRSSDDSKTPDRTHTGEK
jgi:uncharacterized membrane protein